MSDQETSLSNTNSVIWTHIRKGCSFAFSPCLALGLVFIVFLKRSHPLCMQTINTGHPVVMKNIWKLLFIAPLFMAVFSTVTLASLCQVVFKMCKEQEGYILCSTLCSFVFKVWEIVETISILISAVIYHSCNGQLKVASNVAFQITPEKNVCVIVNKFWSFYTGQ